MSLESLRITSAPYAFAEIAAKHNALVDMLAALTGQNGVTVVLSEKNGVIRGNGGGSATISGNVTQVVMANGALANCYVANTNANAYPTTLKTVNPAGNVTIDNLGVVGFTFKTVNPSGNVIIDNAGIQANLSGSSAIIANSATANVRIDVNGLKAFFPSGNISFTSGGFEVTNSSNSKVANIAFASLTHNLTIHTITVCDNGVTKSMDLLASDPY